MKIVHWYRRKCPSYGGVGLTVGGIAKHSIQCSKGIDWKTLKVITVERILNQRKVREGVVSEKIRLKEKMLSIIISTQRTRKK